MQYEACTYKTYRQRQHSKHWQRVLSRSQHNMDSRTYASILETICYADLFDYPLKEEEVRRWIKGRKGVGYTDIRKANGVIIHKDSFVFMKGLEKILQQRIKREKITKNKLTIAQRIVSVLKFIPTVKLIGVSGSVRSEEHTSELQSQFHLV